MPKMTVPSRCAKCGSNQIKHEELSVYGKYGYGGRGYRFDVYICKECKYSEFFYHDKTEWI